MKRIVTKGLGPLRHNPKSLGGTVAIVADEEPLFDMDMRATVPGPFARAGRNVDSATPDTLIFEADVEHGVPGLTRHPDGLTTAGQGGVEVPMRDGGGSAERAPDVGIRRDTFVTFATPGIPGTVAVFLRVAERRSQGTKGGTQAPAEGRARASIETHLDTVHLRSSGGRPRPVEADEGQDEPIRRAVTRGVRPLERTGRLCNAVCAIATTIRSPKDRKGVDRDVVHHVRSTVSGIRTGPHLRKLLVRRKPDFATSRTRGAELTDEVRLGVLGQVHASDGFPAFLTRLGERGRVRSTAPSAPQDSLFSRRQGYFLRHRLCRRDPHGEKRADQDDESFHRIPSSCCATRGWLEMFVAPSLSG